MNLTITNTGTADEAIGAPGGGFVSVLQPGIGLGVNNDEQVLIIGDKPNVREQFEQAAATLGEFARKLLTAIAGRKREREAASETDTVAVSISNHGANAVRVILGDGTTDITVAPGATSAASAEGYVELRELGTLDESQKDGGSQPAPA